MMKASFRFILATLAATATLVGCTKEITPNFENDKVNPEGSRIITVSFAPQTKTRLDGLQPKFEDGKDTVLISNTNALDTCVVSVKDNKATITTDLTGPLTAVYPYKAAKMSEGNENEIDTVLVSTVQSGKFADANICMAKMTDEKDESLSFENKTALFKIIPGAGAGTKYVEVRAEGFDIANCYQTGSAYTSFETIHVATTTADSVYVSILVPEGLKVSDLSFSDGVNEKTVATGARADEIIAAGTLYTVTNANWESTEADIPDGALKGVFSVSADKQVRFSQGNLYYDGSNWGFEPEQYYFRTYEGQGKCDTGGYNINSGTASGHWGLFGWSTSSTIYGMSTSNKDGDYSGDFNDWGKAYCSTKGIAEGIWTTLSGGENGEWKYLFDNHIHVSGTCNNVPGLFIAPDGFAGDEDALSTKVSDWESAQAAGIVFLPAAGYRGGSSVGNVGSIANYWSSSAYYNNNACSMYLYNGKIGQNYYSPRYEGYSVRLVTDVSAAPTPTPTAPEGFVDLGVEDADGNPLYWAECNLGASKPEDYGYYYFWADTTGYTYDSTNKQWVEAGTTTELSGGFSNTNAPYYDVNASKFKKYTDSDSKTVLGLEDDAATQADPNHKWRTPTKDEFVALAANCVWIWCDGSTTKYNETNVQGYIVYKAKNEEDKGKAKIKSTWQKWDASKSYYSTVGASEATGYTTSDTHIFFPAAGYGNGTNLDYTSGSVFYWSSSLYTNIKSLAYYLYFGSSTLNPQNSHYRYHGFPVRPVSD